MTLLRTWLIGSFIIITALAVWAFAPVLVFFALLAAALGLLSAVMIWFARATEMLWQQRSCCCRQVPPIAQTFSSSSF